MSEPQQPTPPVERTLAAEIKLHYDVAAPASGGPSPLLVAPHGYGSNKNWMMRAARALVPEGFAIAAPQGPHQHMKEPKEPGGPLRYGFGWLTNFQPEDSIRLHHRALLDLLATLIEEGVADPRRIFLFGFSQSCALNYRFAFTHADVLRGVVGVCGGLPGDWEASELYRPTAASVLHLAGARDEFYPPARTTDFGERLRQRARDVEVKTYDDAGHELTPAMSADVRRWLVARAEG
ncbi:MAG: alpha/beta hydrolase [Pyrinomonadaceae bacterium]